MCRRSERIGRLGALVCAAAIIAPHAAAQADSNVAIESYLESRGLHALLAAHLQERFDQAGAAERGAIAERLAALYATLLESETDPSQRARWESHARELMSQTPEEKSAELRLNLERARYAQAERAAERGRLRLAEPGEVEQASAALAEMAPTLANIAQAAHQRALAIQQQEESGRTVDPELLARAGREARRQRSLGFYLAGWANVYLAEMNNAPASARAALPLFGWLLGADMNQPPVLSRVPNSSMQFEHVARAAIGVAVAHAVLGDGAAALDWLDFVERHEATPETVRAQVPGRRLTVLARLGGWRDFRDCVRELRTTSGRETALAPGMARLVVVLALDANAAAMTDERRTAAQWAIADLIEQQELAQLVDLTSRFGTMAVAGEGFIGAHVRGLAAYEKAREAHQAATADHETPTSDAAIAGAYRRAADLLRGALESADAMKHPEARATTLMLLGMSLYYGSGVDARLADQAVAAFLQAADVREPRSRAADAMWMAHRAARRASTNAEARASEIAKRFVEEFPDDERAGVLRVQFAATAALPKEDAVAILLETPRESPAYEMGQRHAARLLYELYRAAAPDVRDWAALRYAASAEPLLALDRSRAQAGDAGAAEFAIVRARRLLDALLSIQSPDADRAQSALDALEAVIALGLVEPPPAQEIVFRKLQIALARDDERTAARHAAEIRRLAVDPNDAYPEHADRAMFRHAVRKWRAVLAEAPDSAEMAPAAREVVSRGAQLLTDFSAGAGRSAEALSVQSIIAQAAFDLWAATQEESAIELAYRRLQVVLEARPLDRDALRRLAEVAEAKGDDETAIACWRNLSSGLDRDSMEWLEARVRLMEALARTDSSRAADALRQHVGLRPDLGPEPWASRLRALAAQLGVELANGVAP